MKKITIMALVGILFFGFSAKKAHAWIIYNVINPQKISGSISQTDIDNAVANAMTEINTELLKFQYQPKLGKGFANAGAYAAHAATQRGYQGYDIFAITVGTMAGAQLPSFDLDYYKKINDKLKYKGDFYAGAALVPYSVQVGIHLGKIAKVLDGFYLSYKFGMLNYKYFGYKVNGLNTGFMFNYQIFKRKKAGYQVFVWRGLSVGTGYLYQKNNISFEQSLGTTSKDVPGTGGLAKFTLEPKFNLKVFSEAHVVPVEISTSVRLLWILNLSVGGGIDFAASKSKITAKGYTYAMLIDYSGANQATPGWAFAYGEQKGTLGKWYLPKVTAGVGLSFGPVVIDIPVTYYFVKGFNAGVSVGFEW